MIEIVVIPGHMDSRNKDVMIADGIASGTNDDAAETACNRTASVLAKKDFLLPYIFVAFTGEKRKDLKGAHPT